MNNDSFDNADNPKNSPETTKSGNVTASAGSAVHLVNHSSQEFAELKAECERLRGLVQALEKERDAYQKSLNHFLAQQFTRKDVEASATMEEGVSFDVLLQDMEQILHDYELSKKQ
jgi:hypothetical protein